MSERGIWIITNETDYNGGKGGIDTGFDYGSEPEPKQITIFMKPKGC